MTTRREARDLSQMTILFLTKSFPIYGGVERFIADLASGLRDRGHSCRVGLANGRNFHNARNYARAYPELDWFALESQTGSPIGRRMAIAKALITQRPDIVVPLRLADGLHVATKLKSLLSYKLVYSAHEACDGVARDIGLYGRYLDRVVVRDQTTRRLAEDVLADSRKIRLISHGVPIGRAIERGPADKLRIGFCGRLQHAGKRIGDLVELVARLERNKLAYSLTIAGDGPDRARLENELGAAAKTGEVEFLGARDRAFLYEAFYPAIDIALITSAWETGPLVAFEAMMHQCVVVCADYRGRQENEFLEHDRNCLVYPVGDIEQLLICLQRLRQEPSLVARLGGQARRDAVRARGLERMIDEWEVVVREVQGLQSGTSVRFVADSLASVVSQSPQVAKEIARKMLRRAFLHRSAGEEWPSHC